MTNDATIANMKKAIIHFLSIAAIMKPPNTNKDMYDSILFALSSTSFILVSNNSFGATACCISSDSIEPLETILKKNRAKIYYSLHIFCIFYMILHTQLPHNFCFQSVLYLQVYSFSVTYYKCAFDLSTQLIRCVI